MRPCNMCKRKKERSVNIRATHAKLEAAQADKENTNIKKTLTSTIVYKYILDQGCLWLVCRRNK